MGTNVSFARPDGKSVQGYLAEPSQPSNAPAIVVIQEWWGINAQIRGVADRLASAGYQALVPDLYRGVVSVYSYYLYRARFFRENSRFLRETTEKNKQKMEKYGGNIHHAAWLACLA